MEDFTSKEYDDIDFNDLEYDKSKDIVYNKETGEIIEDKRIISHAVSMHEKKEHYDKLKKKELNRKLGKVDKRETHNLFWKKDSYFIKNYRTEKREYLKTISLSPKSGLLLFCMENYIEYETNRIAKPDGSNFSNKELQELTGLGRDKLKNVLNELEKKLFIVRIGQRQAREIYYNPYLMTAGNKILISTIKLFENYRPITPY